MKNQKKKQDPEKKQDQETTSQKIKANQQNSAKGTGPKSAAGKLRSRTNALKHGIFASELKVNDEEKPEFELLQRALYRQLAPATPLQQIAFERFLCSSWRWKRAERFDVRRLKTILESTTSNEHEDEVLSEGVVPANLYLASTKDRRAALRLLSALRQEVQANGWIRAEEWKDAVTRAFGPAYYEYLTQWGPVDVSVIQLARQLTAHAKNFDMPLPAGFITDTGTTDPTMRLQMILKLIDRETQHLEDLERMNKLGTGNPGDQHATDLDLSARYVTTASREMERALKWYENLKEHGW